MALWNRKYPIDTSPGGDTVKDGFEKIINEVGEIYDKLNQLRTVRAGTTPPPDAEVNELWLDTSTNPPTLKRFDGTNWVEIYTIEEIFKKQGFVNLIKNGNFASWSAGDTSVPDGWNVHNVNLVKKNDDGSLGHPYVTIETDGSGNPSYFNQDNNNSDILAYFLEVAKQQKLTFTCKVKVRTNSDKVYVLFPGSNDFVYHSGSGEWEELTNTITYTGTESYLGVVIGVLASDNTTNITFDVGEVALYIGELPLPYQENPLDRALQAVHYQDEDRNNYEYRGLRCECGINYVNGDGSSNKLEKVVTFQKSFRKILDVVTGIKDSVDSVTHCVRIKGLSSSGFTAVIKKVDNGTLLSVVPYEFYWIAIGVD